MNQAAEPTDSDEIDPTTLTVAELREEIDARRQFIAAITAEIDENDLNRRRMDPGHRAMLFADRARASEEKRELCRVLAGKTNVENPAAPTRRVRRSPAEQREFELACQAEADRRSLERTARAALSEARQKSQDELFKTAVRRIVGQERYAELWTKAREMFPDETCWESSR